MKNNSYIEKNIEDLDLSDKTLDKLKKNDINHVKDVWLLKRKDLKNLKLSDNEINQVIIKLQLHGLDLNKKVY